MANPPETNQGTEAKRAKVGSPAIKSLARSIRRATVPQKMWPIPSHLDLMQFYIFDDSI